MVQPWEADIDLDIAQAARLIHAQFPDVAMAAGVDGPEALADAMAPLGEGWDNRAFLVAGRFVFRFPRREIALSFLEAERAVLPGLRGRLPLPIPLPRWLGQPSEAFPYPFIGYACVPGETADAVDFATLDLPALALALGGFLQALHAIPPPPATPLDQLRRSDSRYRHAQASARLAALADRALAEQAQALLDEAFAALPPDSDAVGGAQRCLVHGDLYVRHLIVREGALAGVIDWGDVHQGDPAQDLAAAWLVLPGSARAAFFAAYGPVDAGTRARARLRAAWDVAITLHYCEGADDPPMHRAALRCLADAPTWADQQGQ
ncbi:MAG: phosphotransferase [Myxococcales bacterium]|nr:phosphotransferase [Myxococcales bacterium]